MVRWLNKVICFATYWLWIREALTAIVLLSLNSSSGGGGALITKSYRFGVLKLHRCQTRRARCRKHPFLHWAEDARLQSAAGRLLLWSHLRFLVGQRSFKHQGELLHPQKGLFFFLKRKKKLLNSSCPPSWQRWLPLCRAVLMEEAFFFQPSATVSIETNMFKQT